MNELRKWITTLSLAALAAGVLLLGVRSWVPEAAAQSGAVPQCTEVQSGLPINQPDKITRAIQAKAAAGHTRFQSFMFGSASVLICSW